MNEPDLGPLPGWTETPLPPDRKNNSFVSGRPDGDVLRVRYYLDQATGQRVARAWFGPGAEGPPGMAHGGSLAAVLDEAMGNNCWIQGYKVLAGTLTIRYRQSLPLGSTAVVRTRIERVDGRKVHTWGGVFAPDGALCTEAEGIFIQLTAEQQAAFAEAASRHDYTMPDAY